MDRSGYARATLAPRPGMQADVPALDPVQLLTMMDMGMAHDMSGGMAGMDHGAMPGMDHAAMSGMNHGDAAGSGGMVEVKHPTPPNAAWAIPCCPTWCRPGWTIPASACATTAGAC